jgi:DNA polymerase-3 subunit delta'
MTASTPAVLAPWLARALRSLLAQQAHAWLIAGPEGLGQIDLALALARAWLCEQATPEGACGHCTSCHAVSVHTHADLFVLMPETLLLDLGWPLGDKAQDEIDSKKRKPSKDIRVESVREVVEFAQRTAARGRGKVVLVAPAERMNPIAANALLKTLEEPAGALRFVLASHAAHALLPTIRSRCLTHTLGWPPADEGLAWLQAQGVAPQAAAVALQASGQRPQQALAWADGTAQWAQLPRAVLTGDLQVFKGWPASQLLDVLQKLCHDCMAVRAGAQPRYFASTDLPRHASWGALASWSRTLLAARRSVEHPFKPELHQEALVSQAQLALNSRA